MNYLNSSSGEIPIKRVFGLDLLRAFAVTGVVFFHSLHFMNNTPDIFRTLAGKGWAGVDLFFVLSGFLIGNQLLNDSTSTSKIKVCFTFWIKRWTRTVPLYLFVLSFYVLIKPTFFHAPFVGGFNWKWLFFLQNNTTHIYDFGQTWSLCIEEQFYFFFPLIWLVFGRKYSLVWLIPMFISLIFRGVLSSKLAVNGKITLDIQEYFWAFRFPTWAMLDSISLGVFLAKTYTTWSNWGLRTKKLIGICGLLIFGLTLAFIAESPKNILEIVLLYFLLALGGGGLLIYCESIKSKISGLQFVEQFSLLSYSIYLIHDIVTRFINRYLDGWNNWLQLTIYILITFFLSKLTYEWIEIPGMKLREKLLLKF